MIAGLFFVAAAALPPFGVVYSPPFHGAPCTQYAGWESFTLPNNLPNGPDDPSSTALGASVWQIAPGGVITAVGNLDNLTVPPMYRVYDSVPADLQEVVFQVSGLLNPFNWLSVTMSYVDTSGLPHQIFPSNSYYLVHQMGHDERVITFDLSGETGTVLSYQIDLDATNSFTTLDAVKLDARYACVPGVPFCSPGLAGVIGCPCANPPAGPGRGCENSAATGGASLASSGTPSLAADSVQFTTSAEPPTASTVLLQGNAPIPTGIAFGQGVRCVGGSLKRLYVRAASGGSISVPQPGDPHVAAQSAALGDPIAPGEHRYYMAYYRDPIVLGGCLPLDTYNGTDALDVPWSP